MFARLTGGICRPPTAPISFKTNARLVIYLHSAAGTGERGRGGDDTPASPPEGVIAGDAASLLAPALRGVGLREGGAPVGPVVTSSFLLTGDDPISSPPQKDASHRCISETSWLNSCTL